MRPWEWALIQYACYPWKKKRLRHRYIEGENVWRQPATSQGEASEDTNPTNTSQISSLRNCEKIHLCCLNHLVCSTSLCNHCKLIHCILTPHCTCFEYCILIFIFFRYFICFGFIFYLCLPNHLKSYLESINPWGMSLMILLKSGKWKWKSSSCVWLFATPRTIYSPWNSLGQNTGVGSLSLLQGIFPTQGSNPGLPHCG